MSACNAMHHVEPYLPDVAPGTVPSLQDAYKWGLMSMSKGVCSQASAS